MAKARTLCVMTPMSEWHTPECVLAGDVGDEHVEGTSGNRQHSMLGG
jgi:hypothetical protein